MAGAKQLSKRERFPEAFNTTYNDPRSRTRTKPMEVLVIGMMRTGTMCESLKSLDRLTATKNTSAPAPISALVSLTNYFL